MIRWFILSGLVAVFVSLIPTTESCGGGAVIPIIIDKKKKKKCFHPETLVQLASGQSVAAKDVKVGQLLQYSDRFVRVTANEPADTDVEREFVMFKTESGNEVTVTPEHMVYAGPCDGDWIDSTKPAIAVSPGECMPARINGLLTTDRIKYVMRFLATDGVRQIRTDAGGLMAGDLVVPTFDEHELAGMPKGLFKQIIANRMKRI
jgi:hypothetical protein